MRLVKLLFVQLYALCSCHLSKIVRSAILPPPWANPEINPCAAKPRGWQLLYWPQDGQCYKIFQVGYPCPETMELSPVTFGQNYSAECRCPPKTALFEEDNQCYRIYSKGPCKDGYFFGPNPEHSNKTFKLQVGSCQMVRNCSNLNEAFYPKTGRCYGILTRGPCSKGQLFTTSNGQIGSCSCSSNGDMEHHYHLPTKSCFEHFTRGPCKEKGTIFLPEKKCGCNDLLPHYHQETEMCYEIGSVGPCKAGEVFQIDLSQQSGHCQCKSGYVRYEKDLICYRPYTQGPCKPHHILLNATTCIRQPCRRGHLYFPEENNCFRIGTRGPCPRGKLVTFDYDTRPSVEGVSYKGICYCDKYRDCEKTELQKCAGKRNVAYFEGKCYDLYKRGPCPRGAWMTIKRQKREEIWDEMSYLEGMCECMPGYRTVVNEDSELLECISPTQMLAIYLNDQYLLTDVNKNKKSINN